jgi:hypothetical protein
MNDASTARDPGPLIVALFALLIAFLFASTPLIFADGDVSWHVASGEWILVHHAVPSTDPFSFTAFGQRWIAQEWLSDVVFALAFRTFGDAGLAMVAFVALAALFAIVGLELRRWASPIQVALTLLLLAMLLIPFTLARPHVLSWPVLAGWLVLHLRARETGRTPPWWALLVMLGWANLHASFIVGLVLSAFFALEALIAAADKRRAFLRWLGFGFACLAAALLTPNGIDGLLYPLSVMRMTTLPLVGEWRPTTVERSPFFGLALVATIAALGWRGAKVPGLRLALVLALLWLALSQMRHQPLWGIVTALLLARPIAAAFMPAIEPVAIPRKWFGAAAVALVLLAVLRASLPIARAPSVAYPAAAIAHVPLPLRRQPVLNGYSFGGPLIVAGIRPFIDGRADLYGDRFVEEFSRIDAADPAALARAIARYHLAWTMIDSNNAPLLRLLDQTPGWRRIFADRTAVIHVHDAPLGPPLPALSPVRR